jgi:hypothetical protein
MARLILALRLYRDTALQLPWHSAWRISKELRT